MKLLDNSAETPACQVKELEAGLLRFCFIVHIAFMDRVVPNFPIAREE